MPSPLIPPHPAESASSGRHRRPESLADVTAAAHHADEAIMAARRAATALRAGEQAAARPSRVERRRQERITTRRAAGRHVAPRGRHVAGAPDPLNITVRPAASARTPEKRPVTGSRRAPGTLPIESWLLVGKTRQQVLLASLVAAGLALVMIPGTQPDEPVQPVNAAGATATRAEKVAPAAEAPATRRPAGKQTPPKTGDKPQATKAPPATGRPQQTTTTTPPSAPADGPSRSLRTTGTSTVALTFDDGPDPVQTPRILAMLDRYDVKATFCLVGVQVERHPDIVREITAAGHTLCNHTWDHSLTIGTDSPESIAADLERTNQAIRAAVPNAEIPFFRAPGGNFSDRLVQVAGDQGMTSLYWEVDPRDWEHDEDDDRAHVDKVVEDVRSSVRPGSIVLSHDFNQPDTITAYEQLLPWLAENFELGTPPVEPPA